MALFSYDSSGPSSNRDQVRMHLGDVDGSVIAGPRSDWTIYLTDGEIDQLLSNAGNIVLLAAARGAEIIAARYLRNHPDVRLGAFSTASAGVEHWRNLAKSLLEQAEIDADYEVAPMGWTEDAQTELEAYKRNRNEEN